MDNLTLIIKTIEYHLNECMKIQQNIDSSIHSVESTEHAILQTLQQESILPFNEFNLKHTKDLFSAHFLLMHALYKLQTKYLQDKTYHLDITSIRITRSDYLPEKEAITLHDPLKNYYLDISHYFETSEQEVNALLDNFWKIFLAQDDKHQALEVLNLPIDSEYKQIKKQYRLLAQKHHPDKGGCSKTFTKINAAKSVLDKIYL